jgi:GNAT superfamily N-acetyltransferase
MLCKVWSLGRAGEGNNVIIRHSSDPMEGLAPEDTFVAYDDLEDELGEATVQSNMADMLCPRRPHLLLIRAKCQPEARDALLGAATARALKLARSEENAAARIYTECPPEDQELMGILTTLGYEDNDGLLRMRRVIQKGPVVKPFPAGCTLVRDHLDDEDERRFFLERYNAMFSRNRDAAWLNGIRAKPDFLRLLVVSPDGLAGELLIWTEGGQGVVGIVQTTPSWQRKGVGSYLVDCARSHWARLGVREAYFDVWTRLTGAVRLAATSGFRPDEMLMRYPGIDIG